MSEKPVWQYMTVIHMGYLGGPVLRCVKHTDIPIKEVPGSGPRLVIPGVRAGYTTSGYAANPETYWRYLTDPKSDVYDGEFYLRPGQGAVRMFVLESDWQKIKGIETGENEFGVVTP